MRRKKAVITAIVAMSFLASAVAAQEAKDVKPESPEPYVETKLQFQPHIKAGHKLKRIYGLAADMDGNVYMSDVRSPMTVPTYTYKFDSSWTLAQPQFGYFVPRQFTVGRNGDFYFAANSAVFRLNSSFVRIRPKADNKFVSGANWNNSQFWGIGRWGGQLSFSADSKGTLYIAAAPLGSKDPKERGIWKFDVRGELVEMIPFADILDIAIDSKDQLVVANGKFGVKKLDPKGKVLMEIEDVQADKIVLDAKDNIHVFSRGEGLLRRFTSKGKPLPFTGKATYINGNVLGGGKHEVGKFKGFLVAVDGAGYIYAAKDNGTRVEKYTPAGLYTPDLFWVESLSSKNKEQLFIPKEKVAFTTKLSNRGKEPSKVTLRYIVRDVDNEILEDKKETVTIPAGASIEKAVKPNRKDIGFYVLEVSLSGGGWTKKAATNFGIVPKFTDKFIDDSPFGHHRWGPSNLPSLQKVGVKWTRADGYCSWNHIEPEPGKFEFKTMEAMVNQSSAVGLRCYPVFDYLANWMVPGGGDGYGYGWHAIPKRLGPKELSEEERISLGNDDYANYCGKMAARYKGKVLTWEIWNEPEFFWGGTPKHYVDMLKKAYAAIKKADPKAKVGIAGALGTGGYLEKMYQAGAKGNFDIVTLHYFGAENPYRIRQVVQAYRKIMAKYGDEDLPLWDTEERGGPIYQLYCHVMAKAEGVAKVFLFPSHGGGIVTQDGTPTPTAVAHAVMAKRLEGADLKKEINLGTHRDAFLFQGRRKNFFERLFLGAKPPFAVVWSYDNKAEVTMTGAKGKEVTVVDRFGRVKNIPAKNGTFLIALAREPVYIQDITNKLGNQVALDMGLPKSFRIGEANKVTVTVLNQLAKKGSAKLTLKAPKGWKVTPADGRSIALDPEKGKATFEFTVLPIKGKEGASNPIEASLAQGGARLASVRQTRPAAITLNLSASFPKTIDPGEKAKLALKITHNLSQEMWGGVRIKKLPKGWTISPADKKLLTFKPSDREMTAEFEITAPKDIETPYGDHGFRVEASVEGRIAAGQNIRVSLPKLTKNIAPEAKVTTPDGLGQQPGRSSSLSANKGDKAINDGNRGTFTQKVVGAKEYLIDFEWKDTREFNAIRIFGAWGCGIQSFDVIADGKKVTTVEDLKYVGPITMARFGNIKAKKLRLRVFKCLRNAPVIFEIEIYKLAK